MTHDINNILINEKTGLHGYCNSHKINVVRLQSKAAVEPMALRVNARSVPPDFASAADLDFTYELSQIGNARKRDFPFRSISMAFQRNNAAAFAGSFVDSEDS
jgi:hypothetical protein